MNQAQQRGPIEAQNIASMIAVRNRLWNPQNAIIEKPVLRLVQEEIAPVALPDQQDAHVKAWRAFLRAANVTPMRFLRIRCADLGLKFEEIVGRGQVKRLVDPRHQLMVELKAAFPRLGMPHIGRMFGGRDHTVVRWAFIKAGLPMPKPVTLRSHAPVIKGMLDEGATFSEIGRAIDYSFSAVSMFVAKRGWGDKSPRSRVISDHAETVERMWNEGAKLAAIAEAIDFETCSISRYIRKKGWTRA